MDNDDGLCGIWVAQGWLCALPAIHAEDITSIHTHPEVPLDAECGYQGNCVKVAGHRSPHQNHWHSGDTVDTDKYLFVVDLTKASVMYDGLALVDLRKTGADSWVVMATDFDFPFSAQTVDNFTDAQVLGRQMAADIIEYRRALDELKAQMHDKYGANHVVKENS